MRKSISKKRIYEPSDEADGCRVLIDRLWPRGISRQTANIDLWAKSIAPSNELRIWYGHKPERWPEFRSKYDLELEDYVHRKAIAELEYISENRPVTLLFAAKDELRNHAVVLLERMRVDQRQKIRPIS